MITYQTITFDFNFATEKDSVATNTFSVDQGYEITRAEGCDSVTMTHVGAKGVYENRGEGRVKIIAPPIEPRGDGYTIPWARAQYSQTVAQYAAFEAFEQAKRDKAAGIVPQAVAKK